MTVMKRLLKFAVLLALLCCYAAAQESPDKGSIQQNTYSNSYFRLSYTFPEGFVPAPAGDATSAKYRLLQLDSQSRPEHITITAEPASGIGEGDLLEAATAGIRQQGFTQSGPATSQTYGGLTFRSASFRKARETGAEYLAVAATLSHDYILEFFFASADEQELANLLQSARSLEIQPDWSSGEPIDDSAPAGAPRRIRDSQGVQERLLLRHEDPKYPPEARKNKIQGTVQLMIVIAKDGTPQRLYVLSGNPLLASAALDAVSRWRYQPYILNGTPVVVQSLVTINFILQRSL